MKKIFAAAISAAMLLGTVTIAPSVASAASVRYVDRQGATVVIRTPVRRNVCRTVIRKKVVYRNGKRQVITTKVRRCRR